MGFPSIFPRAVRPYKILILSICPATMLPSKMPSLVKGPARVLMRSRYFLSVSSGVSGDVVAGCNQTHHRSGSEEGYTCAEAMTRVLRCWRGASSRPEAFRSAEVEWTVEGRELQCHGDDIGPYRYLSWGVHSRLPPQFQAPRHCQGAVPLKPGPRQPPHGREPDSPVPYISRGERPSAAMPCRYLTEGTSRQAF